MEGTKIGAEMERDRLREERDKLQARVNILEHEAQRSKGGMGLGPTAEGGPESPRVREGGSGGGAVTALNPSGTHFLLADA